ncbi:MAG: response regulator [Gemmatimonadetes bacterium]|nr:response regulator [Gemmatimonadota bacterium]
MGADDASPPPPRGSILVADDEPHIRRVLTTLLRNAEFQVLEACDGAEAWALVDSPRPIDLAILDLMMPKATGLEVLAWMRRHPRHARTPVIILTAKGQDTDRQKALSGGAEDFLTKPFSPKKLLLRIREILSER